MPAGVLIVDDDARFRTLARALLRRSGYLVAGEAADGAGAVAAVRHLHPKAVLLDVQLPDIDGLVLARTLTDADRHLRIVLTSTDPTLVGPTTLARSGAVAFVPKDQLAVAHLAPWLG